MPVKITLGDTSDLKLLETMIEGLQGKLLGDNILHWQPLLATYWIALITSRRSVMRAWPPGFPAGNIGAISAHFRSVKSLGYRRSSRLC